MNEKRYTCARCKKGIIRSVESCNKCLKDFHPCCIKAHKIFNQDGHLVPCDGKRELLNLNPTGKKEFKRRSTFEFEVESLSSQDNGTNEDGENNNTKDDEDYNNVLDITTKNIVDKIEQLNSKNINIMKTHVQKCVKDELSQMLCAYQKRM